MEKLVSRGHQEESSDNVHSAEVWLAQQGPQHRRQELHQGHPSQDRRTASSADRRL